MTLGAGDTLYIPRGVMHDAIAESALPSLHVTLGVFPAVVEDLLHELIRSVADDDVEFRRALEKPWWPRTGGCSGVPVDRLRSLLDSALSQAHVDAALARWRDELVIDFLPAVDGAIDDIVDAQALERSSIIALRADRWLSADWSGQRVSVRTPGRVVAFDAPMSLALRVLLESGTLAVENLPGLGGEQQVALGRQLLSLGLVRRVQPEG